VAGTKAQDWDAGGDYVFVSYARADERAAKAVINILRHAGFRVWWDGLIPGGERFQTQITDALEGAKAVVVLWSANSSGSFWVQDEASLGRDRNRLVPLVIDDTQPPLGFRQFQCCDVSHGGIKATNPAMQRAIAAIGELVGRADPTPGPGSRREGVSRRTVIGAGGALAVAGGGIAVWQLLLKPDSAAANSIAVLPFENLSGDAGQQYLSDGVAAELRAKLARNSLLTVVGQASSNAFRDRAEGSKSIARKLRVANLVEGNVRAAGNQVRIAVDLIDGISGFSKWSNSFDRPLTNLLQVQSDIADAVTEALSAALGGARETHSRSGDTANVAAFDAYLRGKQAFDSQKDEASDRAALDLFSRAVELDPDYSAARAGRSRSLAVIANQYAQADERRKLYEQAVDEARRAIASAGEFPDGHAALGYALFYGKLDIRAADAPFEKALELGQGSPDVLNLYALFRARRRQFAPALSAIQRARKLDPLNASLLKTEGRIHFAAGDHEAAIASARQALEMNKAISGVHGDIGNALLMLGRPTEAATEFALEKSGLLALPGRAMVALKLGKVTEAEASLHELKRSEGDNGLYQQAQVLAQMGKMAEALDALDKAVDEQDSGLVYLHSDPFLAPVRQESRFNSLLRRLHFV
jgi:TolB-like protein